MNWQPIETAPKDGRPVWVRGHAHGFTQNHKVSFWAYYGKWGGWCVADGSATSLTIGTQITEWANFNE